MGKSTLRSRAMKSSVVKKLADAYIDSAADPDEFGRAVSEVFPEDEPLVFYWYHPNLESFVPVLHFGAHNLVWDVANELVDRWGL